MLPASRRAGWQGLSAAPALLLRPASRSVATAKSPQGARPSLGVVGVGKMGAAMAANFLEAGVGRELVLYDKHDRKGLEPLVAKGAVAARSVKEVAERATVVVTMLPNDEALCSVADDLLRHLQPGSLHISCSTVSPFTSRSLAQRHAQKGLRFVGAPVFARPDGVARREAYWAVGATDPAAIERATPILLATGAKVFTFSTSDAGAGNVAKLAGNFLIASAIESIGEALALAENQGLDRSQLMDMLGGTIFDCLIYRGYGQRIAQRDHRPGGFSLELGYKDVALVRDTAQRSKVPMPYASLLHDRFLASFNKKGRKDLDWSAIALANSEEAGVKLPRRPEKGNK